MDKLKRIEYLYDLKDIFDGNIRPINEQIPILVDETDVNYDLLDRTDVINKLFNAIVYSRSSHSYVIGLEGPWGSGKTTILNNVKSKIENEDPESFCCIDSSEYDPWAYKTSEEMIYDLCKVIVNKLDSPNKRIIKKIKNNMIYLLSDFISDIVKEKFHLNIEYIFRIFKKSKCITKTQETIQLLKKELMKNDKSIVLYIENIDRASKEKILLLFSMIGTIFNLPNIVYVIAYAKDRLVELFNDSNQINPEFLKKIINQEITIPNIDGGLKHDIFNECITNVLKGYGLSTTEINEYEYIMDFINTNVHDLRELKRLINSAFYLSFSSFQKITFTPKKLTMQIIRFMNEDLFNLIENNKNFFEFSEKPSDLSDAISIEQQKERLLNLKETGEIVNTVEKYYQDYVYLLLQTFPILKEAKNIWDIKNVLNKK